jgi:hypothetical protein
MSLITGFSETKTAITGFWRWLRSLNIVTAIAFLIGGLFGHFFVNAGGGLILLWGIIAAGIVHDVSILIGKAKSEKQSKSRLLIIRYVIAGIVLYLLSL